MHDELYIDAEVHLSDENGNKESENDKRCMIEARLKGRQPIAVTDVADTYDHAVNGAIDKLKTSLDTILVVKRSSPALKKLMLKK